MEKNIEELKGRRNKLKSLLSSSGGKDESSNGRGNVAVNIVSDGMEILISHSIERSDDFELSQVLAELQRSELDVIHIVSSRTNERYVHKIQVEVKFKRLNILVVIFLQEVEELVFWLSF